jgi:hypothetical protein
MRSLSFFANVTTEKAGAAAVSEKSRNAEPDQCCFAFETRPTQHAAPSFLLDILASSGHNFLLTFPSTIATMMKLVLLAALAILASHADAQADHAGIRRRAAGRFIPVDEEMHQDVSNLLERYQPVVVVTHERFFRRKLFGIVCYRNIQCLAATRLQRR